MSELKYIVAVHGPGSTHWVGDGFPVRNLFPSNGVRREIDPFLMLDYAGPTYFEPSTRAPGVEQHPHRGFETVTIVYQGSVEHRDSAGNVGTIGPGDVQWMTAAAGVVHEEKHEREFAKRGGTFEVAQLWVNLPRAHKMSRPRYQTLLDRDIPVVSLGAAGYVRVIAGKLDGTAGPAVTFTPLNVFDLRLVGGQRAEIPVPAGHYSGLVLLKGDVAVNGATLAGEARLALLSAEGDRIAIDTRQDSTLLLLSGEPINEPVASYGPFVMNTQEELRQAMDDYRAGRMGHLA